ncbi:MAG TPA: thioesterase family protein [Pirellulaceae bacterium]
MAASFLSQRRVEFRDTDAAGIAHFSVFFAYMEEAEHALLRSVGLSVLDPNASPPLGWPRVSASCAYRSPARFEDLLEIATHVTRIGDKSVTYAFVFRTADRTIAEGQLVAACCRTEQDGTHVAISIPSRIRERLEAFLMPPTSSKQTPPDA